MEAGFLGLGTDFSRGLLVRCTEELVDGVLLTRLTGRYILACIVLDGLVHGFLDQTNQDVLAQQIHDHFHLGGDFGLGILVVDIDHLGFGIQVRQLLAHRQQSQGVGCNEARQVMLFTVFLIVVLTTLGGTTAHPQSFPYVSPCTCLCLQNQTNGTSVALGDVGQLHGGRVDVGCENTASAHRVFLVGNGGVRSHFFQKGHGFLSFGFRVWFWVGFRLVGGVCIVFLQTIQHKLDVVVDVGFLGVKQT